MTNRERDAATDRLLREAMAGEVRTSSNCLDAETLAAWAEGALQSSERSAAEAHASRCSRCQATLAAMVRTAMPASAAAPAPFRRWMTLLVPAMAAAAAVSLWFAVDRRTAERPLEPAVASNAHASQTVSPRAARSAENEVAKSVGDERDRLKAPESKSVAPETRELFDRKTGADKTADLDAPKVASKSPDSEAKFRTGVPVTGAVSSLPPATPPPPPPAAPLPSDAALARPSGAARAAEPVPAPPAGLQPVDQLQASQQQRVQSDPQEPQRQQMKETLPPQQAARNKPDQNELRERQANAAEEKAGFGGAGRGGAVAETVTTSRRDGYVGVRQERSATIDVPSPQAASRWRILDGRVVQRSTDGGRTWRGQHTVSSPTLILAGTAPAPNACWLVGRGGLVLRTRDGRTWQRIAFPATVDLTAISAADINVAAIVTADGRTFTTGNGGSTWSLQK